MEIKDVKELLNTAIEEAKNKLEEQENKTIIDNNMRNFCKGLYQGLLELYNKILEKESEEAKTEVEIK